MRIGFTLPQFGAVGRRPRAVGRFARAAEELGADSLWIGDRLFAPAEPSVGYSGGPGVPAAFDATLDPFALLAAAAVTTERVALGTNVLQAPLYAPAVLARSLTTIDLLSGGRLIAGLGIGWSPEEYAAAGVPMRERGARLDETLEALGAWWTRNPVAFTGAHTRIPAANVDLKPDRPPPIYLGGSSPAALRRVARRAAGWLPVVRPGAGPFDAAAINDRAAEVRRLAAEHGRDPDELRMILRVNPAGSDAIGPVVDVITRAGRETDVDHAFVDLMYVAHDVDHALELVETILRATR